MSAGLTLTQQPPVSSLVEFRTNQTAHRLWKQMAEADSFQRALVGDLDHRARRETALHQVGVTALDGVYAGILPSLDTLDRQFGEVDVSDKPAGDICKGCARFHYVEDEDG